MDTTTTPQPLTDEQRRAVEVDRFDVYDYEKVTEKLSVLGDTGSELARTNWTGERLVPDVYHSLLKFRPHLNEDVGRPYKVNQSIVRELMDTDVYRQLREFTRGNQMQSALATASMTDRLAGMYTDLNDVQEKADAAQQAADELGEAQQQAGQGGQGGDGDGPGGDMGALLERLAQQSAQADAELDQAVDDALPGIARAVNSAVGEAADQAKDLDGMIRSWGQEAGSFGEQDPDEVMRLMEEMRSPRMRDLADRFGALRNATWGARDNRWDAGPDQLHDITVGNDVDLVLPEEFALFLDEDPELNDVFYEKFLRRGLLQQELRENIKEARGHIIYVEDSSGSMGGDREMAARSVGLALLSIAHDSGRGFTAIVFGGPGNVEVFEFPTPAEFTLAKMLAYARFRWMSAGTAYEGPLTEAADRLVAEFEATGRAAGDIVMATDDECKVGAKWLTEFKAKQDRAGYLVWGIGIGASAQASSTMTDICSGRVAPLHRLDEPATDLDSIFRGLA